MRAVLGIVLGIAAAAVAYWVISNSHQPPAALPTAPTIAAPANTGNYAEDWQTRCAPITDPSAQKNCTAKLDASYGRKAEAPVPSY